MKHEPRLRWCLISPCYSSTQPPKNILKIRYFFDSGKSYPLKNYVRNIPSKILLKYLEKKGVLEAYRKFQTDSFKDHIKNRSLFFAKQFLFLFKNALSARNGILCYRVYISSIFCVCVHAGVCMRVSMQACLYV